MSCKNNIPNIITFLRFIGTVTIIFLVPLKAPYFAVYTLTGVTDVLDGLIARKTNNTSAFGAKLDSMADLCFYTVNLIILLPALVNILPGYIWIIVAVILLVRTVSYIIAAARFRRFASHHTWLNKVTGIFVFAIPYFLVSKFAVVFCFTVCMIGILSTAEDFYIHISSSEYNENIKSVLDIK